MYFHIIIPPIYCQKHRAQTKVRHGSNNPTRSKCQVTESYACYNGESTLDRQGER